MLSVEVDMFSSFLSEAEDACYIEMIIDNVFNAKMLFSVPPNISLLRVERQLQPAATISEKSAIPEKSPKTRSNKASRFARTFSSVAITITPSKNAST